MMTQYTLIAQMFDYPEKDFGNKIASIRNKLISVYPQTADSLSEFESFINTKSIQELQEYFIRTFEVKALCNIDVGYILFGEDYKRGEFLVNIQSEHKKANNDCGSELGDYLPNMLYLLPKIEDHEFAEELAFSVLIPAVKQMIKTFLDKTNIYYKVLEVLLLMLETDFVGLDYGQITIPEVSSKDFFRKQGGCSPGLCKPRKMQSVNF